MCQRIAASLACLALVLNAALARAEQQAPALPPGPAPYYPAPPYSGPEPQPAQPTIAPQAPPLYGHPVPAPQYYPPAIAPYAPAPASCPGSFTIVANGDNMILLDTRKGTTWRLLNTSDGTKWVELKRDQIRQEERGRRPRDLRQPAPSVEASQPADPFGTAVPADPQGVIERQREEISKLRAFQREHAEGAWQLQELLKQKGREAAEAKEKLAKSEQETKLLVDRVYEYAHKVAELEERLEQYKPKPQPQSTIDPDAGKESVEE